MYNWCYWSTGNTNSSNTVVVSPTITTTYSVTCYDVDANASYATYTQSVSACLGIKTQLANAHVYLYPNPATEIITISGLEENTLVEIYNALGVMVYSNNVTTQKTDIELKNLSAGIYFIKLKAGSEEIKKKIIKQ